MSEVSADKLTKAYIKIRAKRAELAKAFKIEDDMLVEQIEKITDEFGLVEGAYHQDTVAEALFQLMGADL